VKTHTPNRIFKHGINFISCSLIIGCATAPPMQEMSDARQSVEAAESVDAEKHAPVALDSAQHLLSKAQDDLEAGDFEEAQKEAIAAREAARQAVTISQSKQTEQNKSTLTKPEPAPEHTPTPEPITYSVNKNDSLWKIAAKNSVYGNPWLWPLILKNNVDLIKSADLINPGLVLSIEVEPSPADIDIATQYAKQRRPASAQHQDSSYLSQYSLR